MTPRSPKRGEIWHVDFNPTRGAEIQKQRPAVVISSDALGKLPLKLVAPLTGWQDSFEHNLWQVKLVPTATNGLIKPSAVDALQVRSVSTDRFLDFLGRVTATELDEITEAVGLLIEIPNN
jgi:mRNA interferase MazF